MEVLLISITDNRENNSKDVKVLGKDEMPEEVYLKPMVNILKKKMKEVQSDELGAKDSRA
ncbi:hypothetical protein [Caloramator sp. Dgby_cultured_2]|uniref:hypothetical protein n=1 Tax=Caloramator sp. Dgby_cultured_2 TaxID=3029174 RepID=UPI00237E1D4F|nr:hypothetical protein [Caloramator sp. Dgby_cultured_2]WDU82308.1 hypothetical protein PWK10_11470 [Caloramator sp. Dgby_cultured_2]